MPFFLSQSFPVMMSSFDLMLNLHRCNEIPISKKPLRRGSRIRILNSDAKSFPALFPPLNLYWKFFFKLPRKKKEKISCLFFLWYFQILLFRVKMGFSNESRKPEFEKLSSLFFFRNILRRSNYRTFQFPFNYWFFFLSHFQFSFLIYFCTSYKKNCCLFK